MNLNEKLAQLVAMRAEIAPAVEAIKTLEKEIKQEILTTGEIPKADGAKVTVRAGGERKYWDGRALEGFAAVHPEILQFRTIRPTNPSIIIRTEKSREK